MKFVVSSRPNDHLIFLLSTFGHINHQYHLIISFKANIAVEKFFRKVEKECQFDIVSYYKDIMAKSHTFFKIINIAKLDVIISSLVVEAQMVKYLHS